MERTQTDLFRYFHKDFFPNILFSLKKAWQKRTGAQLARMSLDPHDEIRIEKRLSCPVLVNCWHERLSERGQVYYLRDLLNLDIPSQRLESAKFSVPDPFLSEPSSPKRGLVSRCSAMSFSPTAIGNEQN